MLETADFTSGRSEKAPDSLGLREGRRRKREKSCRCLGHNLWHTKVGGSAKALEFGN